MKHVLEYVGSLLHLLGMLLFVGGHIWFGFLAASAERHQDRQGARFLATNLPLMANLFGTGVIILFGSGVLRLLVWGEPGLIFLPDPYGWILLSKLLFYMLIVGNGILIERRYLPQVVSNASTMAETPWHFANAWRRLKLHARLNLLLMLVVVALGEAMRYSKL
jgi:uncharacterized membrane protein